MSLFIEPGTTRVEIAGESIEVRILTARQRIATGRIISQINTLLRGKDDEEEVSEETAYDVRDLQFDLLCIGLTVDPDTISITYWTELVDTIAKANEPSEDDSKN